MSSKRKTEKTEKIDTESENVKKQKTDIYIYMQEERQKILSEKESLESIRTFIYSNLERLAFKPVLFCSHVRNNMNYTDFSAHARAIFDQMRAAEGSPPGFDNPLMIMRRGNEDSQVYVVGTLANTQDPMWVGRFIDSASTITYDSFAENLTTLMGNWSLDLYQKCVEQCDILKGKDLDIWANIMLKVFPSAMVEHCSQSDVIADFFHTLCEEHVTIRHVLTDMKPSYLHFFLMNMAAVNRIESSVVLDFNKWKSVKNEFLDNAFRLGKKEYVKLLLQYFPNDLWLKSDLEILDIFTVRKEWSENGADKTGVTYYDDMTSYNTLRLGVYMSMSFTSRDSLTECIRLFWRSSAAPFTSPKHIEDVFNPSHFSVYCRYIPTIPPMNVFREGLLKVYPDECLAEYQPRSLMHLSRCKIRQSLTSVLHVHSLDLPSKLKAYLNLEW